MTFQTFWDKVEFTTDCWNWKGYTNEKGYGTLGGVRAHRISYELYNGKIPHGLEIDHLCRNRKCIKPVHLEAVTHQENIKRGINAQSKRNHCPQGHPYSHIEKCSGHRVCRTCHNRQARDYQARRRLLK